MEIHNGVKITMVNPDSVAVKITAWLKYIHKSPSKFSFILPPDQEIVMSTDAWEASFKYEKTTGE